MAVYERTYHPYFGALTALNQRFLVLPRYAFREVFKSKAFIAFAVACFIVPLLLALRIYIPHNSTFIKTIQEMVGEQFRLTFQAHHFLPFFMVPQGFLAFFMSLIVGPSLVSPDLSNNAMPLYLSRPFNRRDYIMGKACVLMILLSAITWIPGSFLFLLQSYLEGAGWFTENIRTGMAIVLGSWLLIAMLTLLSLAISAYLKWKPIAQAAYFGLFLVTGAVGGMARVVLNSDWGDIFNLSEMFAIVWAKLFGIESPIGIPVWAAWASVLGYCALFLLLLVRKVRAYEVVKS